MTRDTEIGGLNRHFPSTSWTQLRRAGAKSGDREEALKRLIETYWKPVYCFIRRSWGKSNEDAKDLTQEFFVEAMLEGTLVDKFAPARGSFRAYLKTAVTNFIRDVARAEGRQKRGGTTRVLSFQVAEVDISRVVPGADDLRPDQVFDVAWKNLVMSRAVDLLEKRLRAENKESYFEVFRRYDLDPQGQEVSYKSVGEGLGLGAETVKYYLMRAREEFRTAVIDVVSDYVDNDADLSIELNDLFGT